MKRTNIELLAPAKSFEAMMIAYKSGADAVYAGGQKFSARAYAKNFCEDEIIEAVNVSHLFGKKFYLAVNTLVKEKEIEAELYDYLYKLYLNGLDACIIQDIGVFSFIRKNFPHMDVHISTQASITSEEGAKFFESKGATRIVTSREMTLDEIRKISTSTNLEIESFIHGAMCYCYSGQCLFSSMLGDRSGNRGRCAQPCRLPYDILDKNNKKLTSEPIHPLSLKDMCTIDTLPEIIDAGVTSLKVEGRMKSEEYLATVISIYRKYLDMALGNHEYIVNRDDRQKLLDIYNRGGFSKGYYTSNFKNMVSLNGSVRADLSGKAVLRLDKLKHDMHEKYIDSPTRKQVDLYVYANIGERLSITFIADDNYITEYGNIVEKSQKKSDNAYIKKAVTALGNTYFEVGNYSEDIDDDIFIPVAELKKIRRLLIERLMDRYKISRNLEYKKPDKPILKVGKNNKVSVSVNNLQQFEIANSYDFIDRIYINIAVFDDTEVSECIKKSEKEIFIELCQIFTPDRDKNKDIADGIVIKNYEQWELYKKADIKKVLYNNIYMANSYSIDFAKSNGIDEVFVPIEITKYEQQDVGNYYDNIYVYGYVPVMVTRQDTSTTVHKRNEDIKLKDRKNMIFDVNRHGSGTYTTIYNSVPLIIADKIKDNINLHFDFNNESLNEVKQILDKFEKGDDIKSENFTRGHYVKSIK